MDRIHILDKSIYELIAAGEIVDRPCSAIKEMVENSIDAGATKITVEIKSGGKTYIRITDNGCGMYPEDVPLAFISHATSKISAKEDLDKIMTLGFRGEALASICAVSNVEVMTKTKDSDLGYHYAIESGQVVISEPIGCPDGTTFIIRDLFYNVPARQKFLKKDITEGNAIAATLTKLALSHPGISFKLIKDNKNELFTPGDRKLLSCIYALYGKEFYESLIPVNYSQHAMRITGYISKPICCKPTRSHQTFYVNSRFVRSTTCITAVEEAYTGVKMIGKVPACILNIEMDPKDVDINTHPAKIEVRFRDERAVYDVLYFAAKNALHIWDTPVEIKTSSFKTSNDEPAKFTVNQVYSKPEEEEPQGEQMSLNSGEPIKDYTFVSREEGIKSFFARIPPMGSAATNKTEESSKSDINDLTSFKYINKNSLKNSNKSKETSAAKKPKAKSKDAPIRVVGELFKTYIICECGDSMLLCDKHAAHERLIYEELIRSTKDLDMQMLFSPINTTVSHGLYDAILNNPDAGLKFGIGVKALSFPFISIYGVPIIADNMDPIEIVTRFADCLMTGKENGGMEIFDELYHSIACKAAIKANSNNATIELEKLVEMVREEDLRYCPHGRPIFLKLTKREIEKMFKRIQ